MAQRLEVIGAWILVIAAPFMMITKALTGSWGWVLMFALSFAWTIWWLRNCNGEKGYTVVDQEQLASEWSNARVLALIDGVRGDVFACHSFAPPQS
ncbi:hypothetical protein ONA92_21070 [Mycobacteroides salmoniphilum]|uniref:hypothetical protein n=1 Tax=Mycobacteroides salmoniphilum TaxID=404941 RepID=UPI00356B41BF